MWHAFGWYILTIICNVTSICVTITHNPDMLFPLLALVAASGVILWVLIREHYHRKFWGQVETIVSDPEPHQAATSAVPASNFPGTTVRHR